MKNLRLKGKKFMETDLYDGEYFIQKIQVRRIESKKSGKGCNLLVESIQKKQRNC